MKNSILEKNNDKCTSCGICEVVCPKNAIKIYLNQEGFYEPKIDEKKCISCGICKKTCIKFKNIEKNKINLLTYAAKNKNNYILRKSSSGGVSYELMKECIKQEYKIVGVAYDYKEETAITKLEKEDKNLEQFFGSKYMQSYTVEALKEIIKNSNDKYAIFGTPCQIFSLVKYADGKNLREKFLFVDLFCHGCPSINLWKKYLESKKRKYNIENFDEIEFRSKCYGWHEMSYAFKQNNSIFFSSLEKDSFYEIFLDKNVFNRACYGCEIRTSFDYCDIRLGDLWGKTYDKDTEGVSAVVITSEKGKDLFENVAEKFFIKEHSLEEVLTFQSCSKQHIENRKIRKVTLDLLKSDLTMDEIIKEYRKNYSLKKKIKKALIRFLKKYLSLKYVNKLREICHK